MDEIQAQWANHQVRSIFERSRPQLVRVPIKIRIPQFPVFKPLELEDQFEIEQWVKQFDPYSDFNFVSLWTWNTTGGFAVSWLGDNLAIIFNDYGTNERFLSFLGLDNVDATAHQLLEYARAEGMPAELRLLPEVVANAVSKRSGLQVQQSPGHADYVLSTRSWVKLEGKQFRNKRNQISRFTREYAPSCREIDLSSSEVQRTIAHVFGRWVIERERAGQQGTINEALAIGRVYSLFRPQDLAAYGCFVGGRLVAYSINERLRDGWAMGHYWKSDLDFPGAYPTILRFTCGQLLNAGYDKLNICQDLGDPGLAAAKQLFRPQCFLRKFTLTAQPASHPQLDEGRVRIFDLSSLHDMRSMGGFDVG